MNTEKCLDCKEVFSEMKGKLLIKVNRPINVDFDFPIYINEASNKLNVELYTSSVFIYELKEELNIKAEMTFARAPESEYTNIKPDEFTHVEVNYDFEMIKNQYRIKRVRLDVIEHINSVKY